MTGSVMFNVAMMNFSYDVPVKLLATHVVLMSAFLVIPDLTRLLNLFVLNRSAAPANIEPLFHRRPLRIAGRVVKAAVIGYAVFSTTTMALERQRAGGDKAPRPPLYGIWEAKEFERNGQTLPPLVTDGSRWRKVFFQFPSRLSIRMMDDTTKSYSMTYDDKNKTLAISSADAGKEKKKDVLAFSRPDVDGLILEGRVGADALRMKLRRIDESKFPNSHNERVVNVLSPEVPAVPGKPGLRDTALSHSGSDPSSPRLHPWTG